MGATIFTKHALKRLDERSFGRGMVESTISNPDKVTQGKEKGTLEYTKRFETRTVAAIVGKGRQGEDVVLSCWVDPPIFGTHDHHKQVRYARYRKASFWGKFWLDFLSIFGL